MTHAKTDVNKIFSSIAHNYDRLNTILTLNIDQLWRRRALKLCRLRPGARVLDLCCGTGKMMALECRAVGETTQVTGLDFNKEMMVRCKKNLKRTLGQDRFRLVQGDAAALTFSQNSFDCVTIAFGIRNIENKTDAIAEMYRVLRPGGRVVCLELSKPEIPVLNRIYSLYFNHVLPIIGYLGTRDKAAYYYLRDSVNGFMKKETLQTAFEEAGFIETGYKSLSLGIASIHYGVKPNA